MEINGEDLLASLNRLLEGLHQAGLTDFGSHLSIVYVAPGAQYVRTIHNQYPQHLPAAPRKRGNDAAGAAADPPFDADTPLSALFRENHHEELRQIIDSWRPYLIGDDPAIDALAISDFQFDFDKIIATHIYIDLGRLLYVHALKDDNMSLLAKYLYQHSNLSNSESTLYVQLRKYKKR
jgi:hypothetical protein